MRDILAPSNMAILRRFAASRVLVGLDFDGTLAPIVRDPARARMRAATRMLLIEVARAYPCVVISGRSRTDAMGRLRGVPLVDVVGSHGVDFGAAPSRVRRLVDGWARQIGARTAQLPGVEVEHKGWSIAVHFRRATARSLARDAVFEAAERLAGARLVPGKEVLNLLPEGAPHKGGALANVVRRTGSEGAIFVGDDDTDEDAFQACDPASLLSIRVGSSRNSAAAFFVKDQKEVDALLAALVLARSLGPRGKGAQ